MSKVLKIAAIVVGVAAIVATAGAALLPAAALTSITATLGVSLATIGTVLSVTGALLSLAAGVLAKPPKLRSSIGGQQLEWSADPAAGEPYCIGDTLVGASVIHQATWGAKNKYLGIVGAISICTITGYDGLYADGTQITFSGRNATGYYANFLYLSTQLGAMPEAAALDMTAPDATQMPDWGAAYKTSGIATAGMVLKADVDNGKVYSGGAPKFTNRVRGVKAYDARADSTQTGGSGAQRALDETTYVYSENPWVHAETYALGRWQNSKIVIGPGLPAAQIDFAAFMEAASIADANGWKISGLVYSTDRKWDVLKAMAQAGGGVPMPTAARLSCLVNAPKVAIETITEADLKGPVSAPQMSTRRDRLNGAIPRIRSADHGWEVTPLTAVRNSTYLAADGGKEKTREIELPLVADKGDGAGKSQAAQLAAYEVANSRERIGISLELGYEWSQLKLGDCVTLDLPSARLNSQKAVVIGRSINIAHNTVTLTFRTEDDAKHAWALGVSGASTTPPTVVQAPGTGDGFETAAETTQKILTSTISGLALSIDTAGAMTISNHTRIYSDKSVSVTGATVAAPAGVVAGDFVAVIYRDASRAGGAVTYESMRLVAGDELPKPTVSDPYLHAVAALQVSASGTTGGGSSIGSGGGGGGGGGGWTNPTPEP